MFNRFISTTLWILWISSASAQVVLHDTSKFVAVGRFLSIMEDKTARLTFDQVRHRTDFVPGQSENFQMGFSASAYWMTFDLVNRNGANTNHWLIGLIDAATLDYVDLYLVYPDGRVSHQAGGLRRPYVDPGFFATTPFFRVTLPANAPVRAYFRIESSLSMFGKVTVWDEYYNLSKGRVIIFAIWMFLGLFILRSLNNFVLARFIPDVQFRFYVLCTFLMYVAVLSRTGVYPIVLANYPRLLDWMHHGMTRLLPLSMALWVYSLLDSRPALRPLRWLLLGIAGASTVGVFLPLWVQTPAIGQFFAGLVLLMYSLFFGNVILTQAMGMRPPLRYLLPMAGCMVPVVLFQLQSLTIVPYNPLISPFVIVVLAVEMVSMSLVLGRIVQSYIQQRIATANDLIRKKVEVDKLQELDALKTRFFTNISHEFRTPLTLILGPVEQAVEEYAHDARFPLIQRNANRLLSLINQLLDLSKLEVGQLRTEPERGDVAAFFRILASSFSSLADSRRIRFTFTQSEPERWVDFDRDKLEKIVTNLLANAFKFTPVGNAVRMNVRYPEPGLSGTLQCSVEDTGIGIAPDHLTHIFERYYQQSADGQANRNGGPRNGGPRPYEGTGIGLALVNELVKVLNGTIDVVSTEGMGTTFTVTLPLTAVPAPWPVSAAATAPNPSIVQWPVRTPATEEVAGEPLETILLIIDDNADIRAYVRSVFDTEYQIIEAVDGQDGFEKATAQLPTIVICDLMMPRLDGFGFCKALKSQEATSHIPVVMLTAKATVEDRIEGFAGGADDYLTKPFNRAEIRARVRNLVEQRQRLYQWFSETRPATGVAVGEQLPPVPGLPAGEQKFIDRLTAVVRQHLDDSGFNVEVLAESANLSRSQLHRKLKAVTGITATNFIRDVRLRTAAQLLTEGILSVTQVAYAVGFDNLSYFTKMFQEQYAVLPSQYGKPSAVLP